MKVRIHWSIGGYDDSLDIEADTLEEIRNIAYKEEARRGLTMEKNNLWSEIINK